MLIVKKLRLLNTLNVSGCNITDQQAEMIGAALTAIVSLTKLDLSHTTFNSYKATKIISALKNVTSLKEFKVNNNDIDDGAADLLTTVISNNSLIQEINLSHNKLSYTGVLSITKSVSRDIKIFDISGNFITTDTVADLATALSKFPVLQKLNISQNLLTLTNVLTIAQALRSHPTLQCLDLSSNDVSFPSACEFIVDVILSVNERLINLNVCGKNIKPRYIKDHSSPKRDRNSFPGFEIQNFDALQCFSLDNQTNFIKVTETCPFPSEDDITSYYVDHLGAVIYNQCHNFALVVPPGTISEGDCVEIQVTANYFSPYTIPDGFYPISSYFWVGANYEFKAPVYLILNHYAKIRSLEDINNLHVLRTSTHDPIVTSETLKMIRISDGVYFDKEIGCCVLATNHFCSFCQAKGIKVIPEILSACYCTFGEPDGSYIAEVCFCPANSECHKVS